MNALTVCTSVPRKPNLVEIPAMLISSTQNCGQPIRITALRHHAKLTDKIFVRLANPIIANAVVVVNGAALCHKRRHLPFGNHRHHDAGSQDCNGASLHKASVSGRTDRLRQAGAKVFDCKQRRDPGLAWSRMVGRTSGHLERIWTAVITALPAKKNTRTSCFGNAATNCLPCFHLP